MSEEKYMLLEKKNIELEKRVEQLEFKIKLLAENSNTSRLLFESDITRTQYEELMNLMDEVSDDIYKGKEVSNHHFEGKVYRIIGVDGDYHFCESLAQAFMEDGRWDEVFPALYGHMDKFKYYLERRRKGEE